MVEIYGKRIYHNGYGEEVIAASTPWMDSDGKINFVAFVVSEIKFVVTESKYVVYDAVMYPLDDGSYHIKFYNAKAFIGEDNLGRAIEEYGNRVS